MTTTLLLSQAFAQAWTLAETLDDTEAQHRLVGLRRHSGRLDLARQAPVLDQVAALTERLRQRQGGGTM